MEAPQYTKRELAELQLGWLIMNEEQQDAHADAQTRSSQHSKSRRSTRQRAREIAASREEAT